MNRKKVSIAVVTMAVAFLAVTCVTASPRTANTPLYTFRMEQASSEMNFLSTAVSEFTYNTRDGYTLKWGFFTEIEPQGVFKCDTGPDLGPPDTWQIFCPPTSWVWTLCCGDIF